ncbi:MAG: 50S ribosomal protein L21e [Promethearchaeati archaeon]|nr:MAG: 50S ribosomal protein L21e [Candidatus Lokiarchaeota archaeon]
MTLHKGYRNKSRKKYRKKPRQKGLGAIDKYLIDYEIGNKVNIIADPSQQKRGLPHRRYHGRTGVITGIRGRCFEVDVKLGNSNKTIIIGREHLKLNSSSN